MMKEQIDDLPVEVLELIYLLTHLSETDETRTDWPT